MSGIFRMTQEEFQEFINDLPDFNNNHTMFNEFIKWINIKYLKYKPYNNNVHVKYKHSSKL